MTSKDPGTPTNELVEQVHQLKSYLEHKPSKKFGKTKDTTRLRSKLDQLAADHPRQIDPEPPDFDGQWLIQNEPPKRLPLTITSQINQKLTAQLD